MVQLRDYLRTNSVQATMIGVVIFPILVFGAILLMRKYRKPSPGALLLVRPGRQFNRLQHFGLSYAAFAVALTFGALLLIYFQPLAPNGHTGFFRGAKEFALSAAIILLLESLLFFSIGSIRRKKPNALPPA